MPHLVASKFTLAGMAKVMALDSLFSLAGAAALLGWGVLAASTLFGIGAVRRIVPGLLVPLGLAVAYVALMVVAFPRSDGGYGNLDAVARLFDDRTLLLAGWIHYLAFDLLVGVYLAEQNEAVGVPRLLMLPVFAATFLFGPAGFLVYQVLRAVAGRRPLASGALS